MAITSSIRNYIIIICSIYSIFLLHSSLAVISRSDYDTTLTTLPTSCLSLEDGYHWIRPLSTSDIYPNIYVYCSEEFAIIDPSLVALDSKHHPKSYFSSYADITDTVASSSLNNHVTWREWFLPSNENTQFRISPDCKSCVEHTTDVNTDDITDNASAYYMTGNYIGCLWASKGFCDMEPDTSQCYTCSPSSTAGIISGLCWHMETQADLSVYTSHDDCVGSEYNAEPSIGTQGGYCMCYKNTDEDMTEVDANKWYLPSKIESGSFQTRNSVIEIYNKDFLFGSYRITEAGIYRVMEDIVFNMNAGSMDDPNAESAWYPSTDQGDEYLGSDGSFIGPYSMGFFAGFAVECDDVTIDLNGHTLAMSEIFQLQQRWFNVIELGNKAFISGQGPGNYGPYQVSPSNVLIHGPGTIGKSSHHGIHGNGAKSVVIRDLDIKHFEVAGIAFNGFEGLTIRNVNIGPIYQKVPVMGVYTQARLLLPRLRYIADTNPDGKVTLSGRGKYTMNEIADELQAQMDIMVRHFIGGKEWSEFADITRVKKARKLFENVNGLPSASTAYGIFLNSQGASVFAISGAPGVSTTVTLDNIRIFSLYKDPWEVPRIVLTKGPFNDIFDLTRVTSNGLINTDSKYMGNAYIDAQYAIHKLTEDWSVLGHSVLNTKIDKWISIGKPLMYSKMRCNGDIMLHVTKGIFGLRVDNVLDVKVSNVEIFDLQNIGQYGSYICGNYESALDGGHRNQNYPLQRGYTGTEVHAMSFVGSTGAINNIKIHNIVSARGDALALQFYPSNEFIISDIHVSDIHAGAYINQFSPIDISDYSTNTNFMPNKIPRACAIDIWGYTSETDGFYKNNIIVKNKNSIILKCLTTHKSCSNSVFDKELFPDLIQECDETNIVFDHLDMDQTTIFENYIAPQSKTHRKLFNILKNQKPVFFDKTGLMSDMERNAMWILLSTVAVLFIIFIMFKFSRKPKNKNKKNKDETIDGYVEIREDVKFHDIEIFQKCEQEFASLLD